MFFKNRRHAFKSRAASFLATCRIEIEALEGRRLFTALVVTTVDDSVNHTGESLRDAIVRANSDLSTSVSDTITFLSSLNGDTIALSQGQLEIGAGDPGSGAITINGGNQITVSGANKSRVFEVDSGAQTVLTGLTISDGSSTTDTENGGGIENDGVMTVNDCTLSNLLAALAGGGIYNNGAMLVMNSTITGNSASFAGGGIFNAGLGTITGSTVSGNSSEKGGGIYNGETLTVSNSTLFGNFATQGIGGGIFNFSLLTVSHSTLSGNSATLGGGGIGNSASNQTLVITTLEDSIVAGNTTTTETDGPDLQGNFPPSTYNLIGDGTNQSGLSNGNGGNLVGTSANPIPAGLLPLDFNGGPTQTMALTANSLARNAGGRVTSLTAAASSSAATISVGLASAISSVGSGVIQIDGEQMLVTNVDSNSLTVTRGYNGTTKVAHSLGAKVYLATDQTGAVRVLPPDIGAYEYQTVASTVKALPSTESSASFTVSWSGTPGTEGYSISTYTVYVSDNGATFVPFEHQTTDTSDTFTGVNGHTYRFYSVATDAAGNVQPTPAPQAKTTVQIPIAPTITSAAAATFAVGTAGSFTVMATGTPVATFSETGTLPTGVTFNAATGVLGGTPSAGKVGTYTVTFGASNGVGTPASQSFTLTVAKAATTTALTKSTTTTIKFGQSVTFTAAVTAASANTITPTGTVTFEDGTNVLGTAALSAGIAKFTTTTLPAGSHSIKAVYGTDSNFSASTSSSMSQTVSQSSTTTTLNQDPDDGDRVRPKRDVQRIPGGGGPRRRDTYRKRDLRGWDGRARNQHAQWRNCDAYHHRAERGKPFHQSRLRRRFQLHDQRFEHSQSDGE